MDIGLTQIPNTFDLDLSLEDGKIILDDGLFTPVLLSLFSDARARTEDILPVETDSIFARRGWWGEQFLGLESGFFGSRLWLNAREKITVAALERIQENALDSLQWLTVDGIARSVTVAVEREPVEDGEDISILVTITRPDGTVVDFRFSGLWEGLLS